MKLVHALTCSELFRDLDAAQLDLLSRLFVERKTTNDQVLVRQGDRVAPVGDALFLLISGQVSVYIDGVAGPFSGAIGLLQAGDVFGVASIVDPSLRSASCTVTGAGSVACLSRRTLDALVHSDLPLAAQVELALAKQLARDLRRFSSRIRATAGTPA